MFGLNVFLIVLLGCGFLALAFLLSRLAREVAALRQPEDNSGLLMLQGQLDGLRDQLRTSLEGGRLEIDRRLEETNRVVGQVRQGLGEVDRQVRSVADAARDLRGLQDLLRSPKIRGGMGEYLLAELLSEVLPGPHFSLQHGFAGGERVDAAIRLGDRLVPVDAKFPLENFRRLSQAETETAERSARRAFQADVKRHIDDIARRYIRPGEGTYDFAMMYIPAESVYQSAILGKHDGSSDLFEYSLSRRVVPVSPQSFYAYLQVIVLGLQGLSIEGRATEIMTRLGSIRSRLALFTESFDVAARHLGNAQRQVEEARRRLERLDNALADLSSGEEPPARLAAVEGAESPGG